MAVRTGGLVFTHQFYPAAGSPPAMLAEKEAVRPQLPAQPQVCPPTPGTVRQQPPTIVVQNGTGGPNSVDAENRPTKQESPRPQTPRQESATPQTPTQETPRHVQGQRAPAPPRRPPGEPIVRADKEVRAVQDLVGMTPNGMWGDRTSAAVQESIMKFQGENGLPVTGRYTRETAERMLGNPGTKDLATALNVLREKDVLDRVYRVAPVRTVTETVETNKEGEGAAPAAPTTPAPEAAAPTPATAPEASNKTPPVASAAPPTVQGLGPVKRADEPGACTVPSVLNIPENSIPPVVKGGADAGTPPAAAGTNPFITGAVLLPYNLDTKPPETRDLLARPGDPKPKLQTLEYTPNPYSNPKPAWMGAAAELGATLKDAGGNIQNVTAQNEFKHGVTADAFAYVPSLGGIGA